MLELKNIKKNYPAGNDTVRALKGVSLQFRKSEFVSILGPSGCGKTTLLNIIGGLDKYTSGDLIINNRSTKDYRDRDWDAYRNHSVGFVFQSYNLIPHQSVLQNVELALTLSGVSKSERRRRAKDALNQVGLGSQMKKRPSEMSGGQMQRVAIARAIVNNPDIILADEPTGALDTETSLQVMEILKEISKKRLVIMVTHNPDLAEKYSTRIIRMLDGLLTSDSMPLTPEEYQAEIAAVDSNGKKKRRKKLPSMSYATAFGLSLKNLFTKKGRTLLTSFAGSIGIIGIALIYSVSQGATDYIDAVQEETLTAYPLMIQAESADFGSMLQSMAQTASESSDHRKNAVYEKPVISGMVNAMSNLDSTQNDLRSFKEYLETCRNDPEDGTGLRSNISGIQYSYNLDLMVYAKTPDGSIIRSDAMELMQSIFARSMSMDEDTVSSMYSSSPMTSYMSSGSTYNIWQEMLRGEDGAVLNDVFYDQYDLIYGEWPQEYNEVVLVVDKNNEIDDLTLYALGLLSERDMNEILDAMSEKSSVAHDTGRWSYRKVCGTRFKVILPSECFSYDEETGLYSDLRDTDAGMKILYSNGTDITVTGVIRAKDGVSSTILSGAVGYTYKLTEYVVGESSDSDAVHAQMDSPDRDIITGKLFEEAASKLTDSEKAVLFRDHIASLNETDKAAAYIQIKSIPSEEELDKQVTQSIAAMPKAQLAESLMGAVSGNMAGIDQDMLTQYISTLSDAELKDMAGSMVEQQFREEYAAKIREQLSWKTDSQLAYLMDQAAADYSEEECAVCFENITTFSSSSYEENLIVLGHIDLDDPSAISLFTPSFDAKDRVKEAIAEYNRSVEEEQEIEYTDIVGILMSSITTIIHAITYILIAFVAISLVVSSIMIGVITLISVQERTKEIGILRAIGASKRNVSGMFNAETVIIGFTSGLLGVSVTYLLGIPINLILHEMTGIQSLSTRLPLPVAGVLVVISMILTLFAGIIPSRSAAKKDPVVALRTE